MQELRWNPLLGTWTIVAANRQNRPNMPKDWCPFCIGSGKVPDEYDVLLYSNDFPALSQTAPEPRSENNDLYMSAKAHGKCEVILYSPNHTAKIYQLTPEHMLKLVELWTSCCASMAKDTLIQYIFPFENRGAAVGVTMPHPHGQIYGYPFIPLKIKTELAQCKQYFEKTGANMFEEMISLERSAGARIIFENDYFIAFIPYFTDYPYGVFIVAKNKRLLLTDFNLEEKKALGVAIQDVVGAFDMLFDKEFPYMMCFHQAPVNTEEVYHAYYRFHIEFYPPWRNDEVIKFYASSETGAWAATNTRSVEESAEELRQAYKKYKHAQ